MSNATGDGSRTSEYGGRRSCPETDESSDRNDADRLDERLSAVERALTGSDATVADLGDDAAAAAEREALASRVADLESRVEELEAATQAIRGYVGAIRAVNRDVERRADLALARASRDGDAVSDIEAPSESTLTDEDRPADDDRLADENPVGDLPGDAIPSEAALDAAVTADDARRGQTRRDDAVASTDWDSAAGDDAEGSWRDEALDRLRESL
jgi:hypothetical protein